MTKLQELKHFDDGGRPATQRLSLARADSADVESKLTQDTLAEWIRESVPPSSRGSQPVELEGARSRRPPPQRVARRSGYRMRPRSRRQTHPVLWSVELVVCVVLWSVLLLWLLGAVLRLPSVLAPARDLVQGVGAVHGQLVERAERLLMGD